jgi:serine protease Do
VVEKSKAQANNVTVVTNRFKFTVIAGLIILCVSAGFVGGWLGASSRSQQSDIEQKSGARQIVLNESQVISDIAKDVGESVVSISVRSQSSARSFFGFERSIEQESAGTGFILSKEGIILTNRHVIPTNTSSVSVTLSDGTKFDDVELIGRTASGDTLDIAFLKIKDVGGKELRPIELGDSSKARVGDKVIAIGNALGQFQNTVTAGIISGYGRNIRASDRSGSDALQNLFQTDAAINQGNSGGPLVNINGEVIGINTAVAGGQAENIGFAIPIDDVKGLIDSVLDTGKLSRPYLGVRYIQLTDDLAVELGLSVTRGAYLTAGGQGQPAVLKDSPADKAGLKEGDIIIKVGDDDIGEGSSLVSLLGRHKVGARLTLTIVRDSNEKKIDVTLGAAPQE